MKLFDFLVSVFGIAVGSYKIGQEYAHSLPLALGIFTIGTGIVFAIHSAANALKK